MIRHIPLTKGQIALVDDEMYEYLMQWKWHLCMSGGSICYAVRLYRPSPGARQKSVVMHRVIMETYEGEHPDLVVDHIDHNGLNNTRANLRWVTPWQNAENRRTPSKTGYPGVYYDEVRRRYRAYIPAGAGKQKYIGLYLTAEEAYQKRIQYIQEKGAK